MKKDKPDIEALIDMIAKLCNRDRQEIMDRVTRAIQRKTYEDNLKALADLLTSGPYERQCMVNWLREECPPWSPTIEGPPVHLDPHIK